MINSQNLLIASSFIILIYQFRFYNQLLGYFGNRVVPFRLFFENSSVHLAEVCPSIPDANASYKNGVSYAKKTHRQKCQNRSFGHLELSMKCHKRSTLLGKTHSL